MAVGDYLYDDEKPPPILIKALNYEKWGIGDIMQLPAGILPAMNTCLSYYYSIKGYRSAAGIGRGSDWTKQHPDGWKLVSYVIKMRMDRKRANRSK